VDKKFHSYFAVSGGVCLKNHQNILSGWRGWGGEQIIAYLTLRQIRDSVLLLCKIGKKLFEEKI